MSLLEDVSQSTSDIGSTLSSWAGLVVFCAGTSWDTGWYPEKHIATRLASRFPILYVDPPTTLTSVLRGGRRAPGLRLVQPGIAVLTPITLPAASWKLMRSASLALVKGQIRRAVTALGQQKAKTFIVSNHENLFGSVPAERSILYATDNFVSGAELMGLSRDYLKAQETAQARNADTVVVVTEDLKRHWGKFGHTPVLVPNGCDTERFRDVDTEAWPLDVDLPRPIAGVFGHLSERIDLALLEATADRGVSLLLVGSRKPSFSLESLTAKTNVRYLGPKPFETMARYLRAIDVGLTPYTQSEFNRSSFPMKTIEYLAAGRPAVATSLPAVRWLNSEYITSTDTPSDFADATVRLLKQGRSDTLTRNCRAFAQKHSWGVRAEQFAALID
jgi:teichuronic acid biosynthesis glycosyltransferase TuaH